MTFVLKPLTDDGPPKYQQIANQLRAGMLAGEYRLEAPLPAQEDLAEFWGVVRETVKRAFDVLREEGLVYSGQGRRSIVGNLPTGGPPPARPGRLRPAEHPPAPDPAPEPAEPDPALTPTPKTVFERSATNPRPVPPPEPQVPPAPARVPPSDGDLLGYYVTLCGVMTHLTAGDLQAAAGEARAFADKLSIQVQQ